MTEIALVNPNVTKPTISPLGLEYLTEACRQRSVEIEVVDLCFEDDPLVALQQRLSAAAPKLVGISVRNTDNCYLLSAHSFIPHLTEVVSAVRDTTSAPIVLGGAGFSVAPAAIMKATGVEYGVQGDGEQALPRLLQVLHRNAQPVDIPGLLWRADGRIHANAPAWPPISGQPGLRRDTIDNWLYFERGGQLGLETKRGCNRRCIYCADPFSKGRRLRTRSPAAVADEIENLLAQGCDVYHICDSEFNIPEQHAHAVCQELIRRRLGERIRWYAYLAPAPFSRQLAELMRQAGCRGIDFGADSGNDQMLTRLGRDFSTDQIRQAVEWCREYDIAVMLDLLIGGPGESRRSATESVAMAKAAQPSCVGISLGVRIYPGTRLAAHVAAQGPMARNPALWGATSNNEQLLAPVFYLSPQLGSPQEAASFLKEAIAGDQRFFFGGSGDESDYDYDDNQVLIAAIAAGARGAYWDILRRLDSLDQGQSSATEHPVAPSSPGSQGRQC